MVIKLLVRQGLCDGFMDICAFALGYAISGNIVFRR